MKLVVHINEKFSDVDSLRVIAALREVKWSFVLFMSSFKRHYSDLQDAISDLPSSLYLHFLTLLHKLPLITLSS